MGTHSRRNIHDMGARSVVTAKGGAQSDVMIVKGVHQGHGIWSEIRKDPLEMLSEKKSNLVHIYMIFANKSDIMVVKGISSKIKIYSF